MAGKTRNVLILEVKEFLPKGYDLCSVEGHGQVNIIDLIITSSVLCINNSYGFLKTKSAREHSSLPCGGFGFPLYRFWVAQAEGR